MFLVDRYIVGIGCAISVYQLKYENSFLNKEQL